MTKPHVAAERTLKNDRLILRWIEELPDDFERRVLQRLDGWSDQAVCWVWQGALSAGAYGSVVVPRALGSNGERTPDVKVHRVVWLSINGEIPYGLTLDHHGPDGCGNKRCANPAHLTVVSHRDNIAATGESLPAIWAARDVCDKCGGAWDTAVDGTRICRACRAEYAREYRAGRRV